MRARLNPFFSPAGPEPGAAAPARPFHRSLPEYQLTPLHVCRGLARALGIGALYLKDESYRFGLNAFKGLGASWALERLCLRSAPPRAVASATEGNHGRAVAWAARRKGLHATIFIPAHAAPARVQRLREEGASVELVEGSYDAAVERCAEVSARRNWQVVSDTGYPGYDEIPRWIAEGYATLFEETDEQLAALAMFPPTVVLVQAGVGGLLHAAVSYYRSKPRAPILGAVEPVAADALTASIESPGGVPSEATGRQDSIMAGLNCGRVSLTAWPAIRSGVELFITVGDAYAVAAMRRLARPCPGDPVVVAGETGAAGLAGLLAIQDGDELAPAREFLRLGPESRVLLISTEGATDPDGYRRIVDAPD